MTKAELREKYKLLREGITASEIEEYSLQISNNSLKLDIWNFTYYHIFLPISEKKEVNTEYILHILQGKDKSIVIPKADFTTTEMTNYLLQENTVFRRSSYGITEPVSGIEISHNLIEVVFVPLLAYDTKGNRIGYGKGFYDRFLKNCKPNALFIGLSFFPPEENIVHEIIDIPLDFCVTPHKTYKF
tara:strand:+ start:58 stop:618 length:561 start_codon:yes stop_codon:yes gene_type:complete